MLLEYCLSHLSWYPSAFQQRKLLKRIPFVFPFFSKIEDELLLFKQVMYCHYCYFCLYYMISWQVLPTFSCLRKPCNDLKTRCIDPSSQLFEWRIRTWWLEFGTWVRYCSAQKKSGGYVKKGDVWEENRMFLLRNSWDRNVSIHVEYWLKVCCTAFGQWPFWYRHWSSEVLSNMFLWTSRRTHRYKKW